MATTDPTARDSKYIGQLPTTANTNIPPCGAISVHLKNIDIAPAIPEPIMHAGITLRGSLAAYGMAPSVIKLNPII